MADTKAPRFWRRHWVGLLCIALVLAVCAVCFFVVQSKVRRPHGPYTPPPDAARNLEQVGLRVRNATEGAAHLSGESLGNVQYSGFQAPLWVVRYTPPEPVRRRVLVTGGVHGNEPMSVETVLRFIERLRRMPEAYPDTAFDLVPLVNPWGWVHGRRLNQQGYDINRDFGVFNTREAQLLRAFLADTVYDVAIDHHEDNSATGFYLYNIATPHAEACRELIEAVRAADHPIEQDVWMVIFKTDDGLIDAPLWSLRVAHWTIGNSLANYVRLRHCDTVFLVETPTVLPVPARLELHEKARTRLMAL